MGSIPCNIFCCSNNSISPPKSDLFVPQININAIKSNKSIEKNFVKSIKEKSPNMRRGVNRITTEQFIQDNNCLKNTYTADGNIGRTLHITYTYKNYSLNINNIKDKENLNQNQKKQSKQNLLKISLTNYSLYKNPRQKKE